MSREAMKLALEALETERENYQDWDRQDGAPEYIYEAITALREALAEPQEKYIYGTPLLDAMTGKANEALDKMAENARELGLDYEPARQEPVIECDCETATSPDGSRLTKCGSDQMRRAVEEGHAFCKQPAQQEPFGCIPWHWVDKAKQIADGSIAYPDAERAQQAIALIKILLKSTPPQRKPLTDEEIYDMYNEPRSDAEMIAFARAIEAAHGIKGEA